MVRTADLLIFRQLCENAVGLNFVNFGLKCSFFPEISKAYLSLINLGMRRRLLLERKKWLCLKIWILLKKCCSLKLKKAAQVVKAKMKSS